MVSGTNFTWAPDTTCALWHNTYSASSASAANAAANGCCSSLSVQMSFIDLYRLALIVQSMASKCIRWCPVTLIFVHDGLIAFECFLWRSKYVPWFTMHVQWLWRWSCGTRKSGTKPLGVGDGGVWTYSLPSCIVSRFQENPLNWSLELKPLKNSLGIQGFTFKSETLVSDQSLNL
jgi:hypothetical protein